MGCCPPMPTFGLEHILNRIRCVLACCWGRVIVQNSEFCDGENTGQHLSGFKSSRKFRWLGCCVPSSQREGKKENFWQTSSKLAESARCLRASQACAKTLQKKSRQCSWYRQKIRHEHYKQCSFHQEQQMATMKQLLSFRHNIVSIKLNKIVLSPLTTSDIFWVTVVIRL